MKNYIKCIGILALALVACEPEFENPVDEMDQQNRSYSSGEADFSHYIALGNSLTAGYADNALYISGQENSYPNLLAQQFARAGGGEFSQPLMADNSGGLLYNQNPLTGYSNRRVLGRDSEGNPTPIVYTGAQPTTDIAENLSGPFNNMGVPGAKIFHLGAPGYGNVEAAAAGLANPYFARFASNPTATVIGDAMAQNPTFFSLWIGNNDVLSYATSGGSGVYQDDPSVSPSEYGSNDITNPLIFTDVYSNLVNGLKASGAEEGVLINIPNVTDVPFFTTVPYAPLNPENEAFGPMISTLNTIFAQINPALTALRGVTEGTPGESVYSIEFSETGASPVLIHDESLPNIAEQLTQALIGGGVDQGLATIYGVQFGQARQATAEDLLVLTSSGAIGQVNSQRVASLMAMGLTQDQAGQLSVNGVTYPMEDRFVLIPSEQEYIETATQAYNQAIRNIAETNGLAFVDANSLLSSLSGGGIVTKEAEGRVLLTSDFITGGAFSLDGIHLTPQGNAFITNRIMEKIEETYGAELPRLNVGHYPTVTTDRNLD